MGTMYSRNILLEKAINLLSNLRPLHDLTDNSIDSLHSEILQYISVYPGSTAYDMYRKRAVGKDYDERSVRRHVSDLEKMGLIERVKKEPVQHKAKPCRLTISGIAYLIMKKEIMYNDIIRGILKNYGNNPLFQIFVYSYIGEQTLLRLTSFNSLSPLSLYLYECCRELNDAVSTVNTARSKYLTEQLFVWQHVPSHDERETNCLREFLKREFKLSWVDLADFEKIENDRTLRISYKVNSVLIKLNNTRTKAILRIRREEKYEFIVRVYSDDYFLIEAPSRTTVAEQAADFLLGFTQSRVPSFIFNLTLSVVPGFDDFRILSQDRTFMETLEKTKLKFISQYEMFAKA
jgi:hypothetical protein